MTVPFLDRRRTILGIAIAASIGTSPADDTPPPPAYLFQGFQDLEAGPFTLDVARPERAWTVTAQLELPQEAERADFVSKIAARVRFVDPGNEHEPVTYRLTDCAGEALAVNVVKDPYYVGNDDAFVDCVPETPCIRSVCLEIEISNDEIPGIPVEVNVTVWASIAAGGDPVAEPIDVPIDLTLEEIEP